MNYYLTQAGVNFIQESSRGEKRFKRKTKATLLQTRRAQEMGGVNLVSLGQKAADTADRADNPISPVERDKNIAGEQGAKTELERDASNPPRDKRDWVSRAKQAVKGVHRAHARSIGTYKPTDLPAQVATLDLMSTGQPKVKAAISSAAKKAKADARARNFRKN